MKLLWKLGTGDEQIRTNRTVYQITSGDVLAGFAAITVLWDIPFADTNYTLVQGIIDRTAGGPLSNDYSPGDVHDLTVTGFTSAIYVGPGAAAGEIIELHSLGIHD